MDCVRMPQYSKCPPRMNDGRHFTDYRANDYLNSSIRYSCNKISSSDYRSFLTHNAVELMNKNSDSAWKRNGCGPCKNMCLGIDETQQGGIRTYTDHTACIPPTDFLRYVGADGTVPSFEPAFGRVAIPSGAVLPEGPRGYS